MYLFRNVALNQASDVEVDMTKAFQASWLDGEGVCGHHTRIKEICRRKSRTALRSILRGCDRSQPPRG